MMTCSLGRFLYNCCLRQESNLSCGLEPSLEEATCDSWTAYIEKLRKIGSWGGRLEIHAIAQLYNIQIHVLTADGFCATAMEQGEPGWHLWRKDKRYGRLTGAHLAAWIKDEVTALGYTGGRSGGKSCRPTQSNPLKLTPKYHPINANKSVQPSRVASNEIDRDLQAEPVFSKRTASQPSALTCAATEDFNADVSCDEPEPPIVQQNLKQPPGNVLFAASKRDPQKASGGVCVIDLCRRSFIGVCRGGVLQECQVRSVLQGC